MKRILAVAACAAMLAVLLPDTAIAQDLWRSDFAHGAPEGWKLQEPVDAMGPIVPNGTWAVEGGQWVATGTAAPWTVQALCEPNWTNYTLRAGITIGKAAPRYPWRVCHAKYDNYLDAPDANVMYEHVQQYRYRYYAGEFDWGSDAAIYVRYRDRFSNYRVQLSTEYQEVILASPQGGYLRVVPCELKEGQTYQLEVQAQMPFIRVLLDGKKLIEYAQGRTEDLPTGKSLGSGSIALGAYNGTVAFQDVSVTAVAPSAEPAPKHVAVFHDRTWRQGRWVFDGDEPIFLLVKFPEGPGYMGGSLAVYHVKLAPGHRPCYYTGLFVEASPTNNTHMVGDENDVKIGGQGTGRLTLDFDGQAKSGDYRTHHTDVLTYDEAAGVYHHDIDVELTAQKPFDAAYLQYADPLTYNNRPPGRAVKYPWQFAGPVWGVYRAADGTVQRHPISEIVIIAGQAGVCAKGGSFWMLYGPDILCPMWGNNLSDPAQYAMCHWGYDFHQQASFAKRRTFAAGERYTIHHTMEALWPDEAKKLFEQSKIAAKYVDPNVIAPPRDFVDRVPSLTGFLVCDPAGTDFAKLCGSGEPYLGWQFYGDYAADREVGHGDTCSLRLDGPSHAVGCFYHNMLDTYAKRYLCTVWVKTRGCHGGLGPILHLNYAFAKDGPRDTIVTGLTGDNDWTRFSWISTVPLARDGTDIIFQLDGAGTAWFDDFSCLGLADDAVVAEHRPATRPAAQPAPGEFLFDLPMNEGQATCLDVTRHGLSGKLRGDGWNWKTEGGRTVLHLDKASQVAIPVMWWTESLRMIPGLVPVLRPHEANSFAGLTIDTWVRPSAAGTILGGSYPMWMSLLPSLSLAPAGKDACKLVLAAPYENGKPVKLTSDSNVSLGRWTHVAGTIAADGAATLYIDGKPAGRGSLPSARRIAFNSPAITIGPIVADVAEVRWWNHAAKDEEIGPAAAKPPGQ